MLVFSGEFRCDLLLLLLLLLLYIAVSYSYCLPPPCFSSCNENFLLCFLCHNIVSYYISQNVKAYLRRGTAREMLGYYKEAIEGEFLLCVFYVFCIVICM